VIVMAAYVLCIPHTPKMIVNKNALRKSPDHRGRSRVSKNEFDR